MKKVRGVRDKDRCAACLSCFSVILLWVQQPCNIRGVARGGRKSGSNVTMLIFCRWFIPFHGLTIGTTASIDIKRTCLPSLSDYVLASEASSIC